MRGRMAVLVLVSLTAAACASGRGRSTQRVLTEAEWDAAATCLTYQAHARGFGFMVTQGEILVVARSQTAANSYTKSALNVDPEMAGGAISHRGQQYKRPVVPNTYRSEHAVFAFRSVPTGIVATALIRAREGREGQWSKVAPSRQIQQVHQLLFNDCLAKTGRLSSAAGDRVSN